MTEKQKFDLKSVVSRGRIAQSTRGMVYGQEGIGKTGFASQMHGVLIVGAEDGSGHYDVARVSPDCWLPYKNPDTGKVEGDKSIFDIIDQLGSPDNLEFKAIAIDTIDAAEKMCIEYICKRDHGTSDPVKKYTRDTWVDGKPYLDGYGYGSGPRVVETEFLALLAALDRLRRTRHIDVLFTAHMDVSKEKNPGGDDYGIIAPRLTKYARDQVVAWCDYVLYAEFSRIEVQAAEHDKKGKQVGKAKVVSDGSRVVHTERSQAHVAKNRIGLPKVIDLSYQVIAEHAKAAYGDATIQLTELRAEIERLLLLVPEDVRSKAQVHYEKHAASVLRLVEIKSRLQARVAESTPSGVAAS